MSPFRNMRPTQRTNTYGIGHGGYQTNNGRAGRTDRQDSVRGEDDLYGSRVGYANRQEVSNRAREIRNRSPSLSYAPPPHLLAERVAYGHAVRDGQGNSRSSPFGLRHNVNNPNHEPVINPRFNYHLVRNFNSFNENLNLNDRNRNHNFNDNRNINDRILNDRNFFNDNRNFFNDNRNFTDDRNLNDRNRNLNFNDYRDFNERNRNEHNRNERNRIDRNRNERNRNDGNLIDRNLIDRNLNNDRNFFNDNRNFNDSFNDYQNPYNSTLTTTANHTTFPVARPVSVPVVAATRTSVYGRRPDGRDYRADEQEFQANDRRHSPGETGRGRSFHERSATRARAPAPAIIPPIKLINKKVRRQVRSQTESGYTGYKGNGKSPTHTRNALFPFHPFSLS
jgi:hypothetical protein